MRRVLFTIIIVIIIGLAFVAGDRHGKDYSSNANKKTEPNPNTTLAAILIIILPWDSISTFNYIIYHI